MDGLRSKPTYFASVQTPLPLSPPTFSKPTPTPEKLYHAAQISMSPKYQGIPFMDFNKGPLDGDPGSDCSGLVASVMIEAGILEPGRLNYYGTDHFREDSNMLHKQRAGYLPPQAIAELQPGDLIFMKGSDYRATDTYPGHMGIYVGNGWMTHCGGNGSETIPLQGRHDVIETKRMKMD